MQGVQTAIEEGHIKFSDQKRPMKIEGNPFPANVNMVGGSSALIKKYVKRQERENWQAQTVEFDPQWSCPSFRYYWEQGMKLPSIDRCPRCCREPENLYRGLQQGHFEQ